MFGDVFVNIRRHFESVHRKLGGQRQWCCCERPTLDEPDTPGSPPPLTLRFNGRIKHITERLF